MNRRSLFKGLAGVAAGLILPPTLAENAEAGKRIYALGGIPTEPRKMLRMRDMSEIDRFLAPVETPMVNLLRSCQHDGNPFPNGDPMRDLWHLMICLPREMESRGMLNA